MSSEGTCAHLPAGRRIARRAALVCLLPGSKPRQPRGVKYRLTLPKNQAVYCSCQETGDVCQGDLVNCQNCPDKEPNMTNLRFVVARLILRMNRRDVPSGYYWA